MAAPVVCLVFLQQQPPPLCRVCFVFCVFVDAVNYLTSLSLSLPPTVLPICFFFCPSSLPPSPSPLAGCGGGPARPFRNITTTLMCV